MGSKAQGLRGWANGREFLDIPNSICRRSTGFLFDECEWHCNGAISAHIVLPVFVKRHWGVPCAFLSFSFAPRLHMGTPLRVRFCAEVQAFVTTSMPPPLTHISAPFQYSKFRCSMKCTATLILQWKSVVLVYRHVAFWELELQGVEMAESHGITHGVMHLCVAEADVCTESVHAICQSRFCAHFYSMYDELYFWICAEPMLCKYLAQSAYTVCLGVK